MAQSKGSKRKLEDENRKFNDDWTTRFFFIQPEGQSKALCLICKQMITNKMDNIRRHYNTKHTAYETNFPPNSQARLDKIKSLKSAYDSSSRLMISTFSTTQRVTEASLRATWVLGKHLQPFTSGAIVKECMLEMSDALFESNQKKTILEKIDRVPMSNQTITRRTEVLANDCFEKLKSDLSGAACFSVALDESTDIKDIAQLCIFVRYFNGSIFVEDLLTMIPLYDRTRGEDIYDAVIGFFRDQNLDIARLVSITTDGAPAMIAPRKGFVSRLKCDHPQMLSYHCIIHQGALCAKLSNIMQAAMTQIMKTVNFLRAKSALQHRQLRTFQEEQDAEYGDLLLHCDVRWLSKGAVLNCFWWCD